VIWHQLSVTGDQSSVTTARKEEFGHNSLTGKNYIGVSPDSSACVVWRGVQMDDELRAKVVQGRDEAMRVRFDLKVLDMYLEAA
jgi:hypothetical protein